MKKVILASALIACIPLALAGEDDKRIEADFEILDSNGDGHISAEEATGTPVAQHFSKVDSDMDGRLSKDEYVAFVKKSLDDNKLGNQGAY